MTLWAGVEAGGTKFVCALGAGPDDLRAEVRIPTGEPAETLARAIAFLREEEARHGPIEAIGIASFGPLCLTPTSPNCGRITVTPKAGWEGIDIAGTFRNAFDRPVRLDTDVNGAALAERRWGAARGLESIAYVTIGTGIGGGGVVHGKPIRGLQHPEMGHMLVPRHPDDDFEGVCSRHGDCVEGLASGPAIEARWGRRGESLAEEHPAWKLESYYLAALAVNVMLVLAPAKLIFGGGVMQQEHLYAAIHSVLRDRFGGQIAYLRGMYKGMGWHR